MPNCISNWNHVALILRLKVSASVGYRALRWKSTIFVWKFIFFGMSPHVPRPKFSQRSFLVTDLKWNTHTQGREKQKPSPKFQVWSRLQIFFSILIKPPYSDCQEPTLCFKGSLCTRQSPQTFLVECVCPITNHRSHIYQSHINKTMWSR